LAGIELAKNGRPIRTLKNGQPVNYFIMKEAQKMGVFLRPLGNIMMFVPPLAIGLSDLDEIIDTGLALVSKIDRLS
jgi:adenosylmethionine-8-amino-7-oxononanoate aminotransferase